MRTTLWSLLALPIVVLTVSSPGCTGWGDDDQTPTPSATPPSSPTPSSPTPPPGDDDGGGDDDDDSGNPTATPVRLMLSGTVRAVDRSTGQELSSSAYRARYGKIVVYALPDPSDLVHPVGKATLSEPGYYTMDLKENAGKLYIVAVCDVDRDEIITSSDLARESLSSPVKVESTPLENIDVQFDFDLGGGGGGGGDGGGTTLYGNYSGDVLYDVPESGTTNIAVAGFRGDYAGGSWGKSVRQGSGDFDVRVAIHGANVSLVGYADADANGLYEPSDPTGIAPSNPYALSEAGQTGIHIVIEGVGNVALPQPIPYISLSGTVIPHATYNNGPVLVAVYSSTGTITYAAVQQPVADVFSLRIPGNLGSSVVQAVTDSDGNGVLDPTLDASATVSVVVGTSNQGGINLVLVDPFLPTGIQGKLSYGGSFTAADTVRIGLFTDLDHLDMPSQLHLLTPDFPIEFEFMGIDADTYYVLAALDVNSDWAGSPGAEDIIGAWTLDGTQAEPIQLSEGVVIDGINFSLGNYHPE